jgi:hypothetical protein
MNKLVHAAIGAALLTAALAVPVNQAHAQTGAQKPSDSCADIKDVKEKVACIKARNAKLKGKMPPAPPKPPVPPKKP